MSALKSLLFSEKLYFHNRATFTSLESGRIWTMLTHNITASLDLIDNTVSLISKIVKISSHVIFNLLALNLKEALSGRQALKIEAQTYSYQLLGKLIAMTPILGQIFTKKIASADFKSHVKDYDTYEKNQEQAAQGKTAFPSIDPQFEHIEKYTREHKYCLTAPRDNTYARVFYECLMIPSRLVGAASLVVHILNQGPSTTLSVGRIILSPPEHVILPIWIPAVILRPILIPLSHLFVPDDKQAK